MCSSDLDVNGDGYSDVIAGAHLYRNGTALGAAVIYYGSASGISPAFDWKVEGQAANDAFGYSVSTAGDVNGDGYCDVIVGAPSADNEGQADAGRAYVYFGSSEGLSTTPAWSAGKAQAQAQYGWSASTAGDVNGDGYADVIVGARKYDSGQTDEGCVYVYYGSADGPSASEDWWAQGNQAGGGFGNSVSTAGDVNGDGFSEVIIGAPFYKASGIFQTGAAMIWYGTAEGLGSDAWSIYGVQDSALGVSVGPAGDVNGDGLADVVVGAVVYSSGNPQSGYARLYMGASGGPSTTPRWSVEDSQAGACLGWSISTAGDVNGDGYADVAVGGYLTDGASADEGQVRVYYGNGEAGRGMSLNPRQRRGDNTAAIAPMGLMPGDSVRLAAKGRTPFGRGKAKLECEVKPLGTAFNGTGTLKTASWTNTGVAGASFSQLVSGLSDGVYHCRMRLLYNPAATPFQRCSRWFTMPWNGWQEGDFRVVIPPPAAPSNPGATDITTSSITWTWTDNSSDETGFKIWADAGSGTPTTLRTTTGAGVTSFAYDSLTPNSQHSFQTAATGSGGDSAPTAPFSAWTLAAVPPAPTVAASGSYACNITVNGGSNPTTTEFAIKHVTDGQWVQSNSTLGSSPAYNTSAAWGTCTVTGFSAGSPHTFSTVARNGAGTVTAESPSITVSTVALVPNCLDLTLAAAGTALQSAYLTTGQVTYQCSNTVAAGLVISQSLSAGQAVAAGTSVGLVISTGLCPVIVPNLVGMHQSNVVLTLNNAGLGSAGSNEACSDTVQAGYVISQDPDAGEEVPYASNVTYTVSSGPCHATVPNLVGMDQSAASAALSALGLGVSGWFYECSDTVAVNAVIRQDPAAGASVLMGSTVACTVSTGPCTVTVPNVVGLSQGAAGSSILGADLVVGMVTQQYSSTVAAGLVISQNPLADDEVPPDTAVDLVVSQGSPPPITGSIVINNNRSATNNPVVTLALTWAGGAGTGVVRMRFSNDGSTWTAWESLAATKSYTLPSGDGHKTVRVQYLDKLNYKSPVFTDYIRLDQTLPTGTIIINGGALTTTNSTVTLGLAWVDTGATVSRMRFSDDGAHWTYWMPPTATRTHALSEGLGYRTVRVQYLDGANNYSAVYSDYIKVVAP